MKVNEFTIGDLVYIYTLPNENPKQEDLMVARLVGVNSDEIDENPIPFCEGRILSTNGIFSRPIDTIIPIPLTEEILKANGWRYDYIYKIWIYEDEDKMDFCVKIDEIRGISVSLYKDYPIIFIKNVHELQHALRLCGRNDIADNFKAN